jgi:5-methylcytosine-specific restriction endonuclease McrA
MPRGRQMPPGWPKLRRAILERDGGRCQIGSRRCVGVASTVDHIKPAWQGGSDHPSNLQAACGPCHRSKTASDARSVGDTKARRRRPPEKHPGIIE